MRNTTIPRDTIKDPAAYVYPHIEIDGVNLTDRLNHVMISCDSDSGGWTAELNFVNHPDLEDLTPWGGGSLQDVLKPNKLVKVWMRATTTKGEYAGDRDLVFEGLTGDDVVVRKDVSMANTVSVRCRSRRKKILQDTFVLDERVYPISARGANPWEVDDENAYDSATVVAQQILDEALGTNVIVLRVQHNPDYNVYPYIVVEEDLWQLLNNLFLATGFVIMEKYWSDTNSFEVVLFDPQVVGGEDSLGAGNYRLASLNFSDSDIRNIIRVYYRSRDPEADRGAGAQAPPNAPEGVLYVEKTDNTSIQKYGRRAMKVVEDEVSQIDTYEEANTFATLILNDLKDLHAEVNIECPAALYYLEPYDKINISGVVNGILEVASVNITVTRQGGQIGQTTGISGTITFT